MSLIFLCLGYKDTVFTIVPVGLELCQVPSLWILTLLAELVAEVFSGFIFQGAGQKFLFNLYVLTYMPMLLGFWEFGACGCGRHLGGNAQPTRPFYSSTAPVKVGI